MKKIKVVDTLSNIKTTAKHIIQLPTCVMQVFLLFKQMGATKPKQYQQRPTHDSSH